MCKIRESFEGSVVKVKKEKRKKTLDIYCFRVAHHIIFTMFLFSEEEPISEMESESTVDSSSESLTEETLEEDTLQEVTMQESTVEENTVQDEWSLSEIIALAKSSTYATCELVRDGASSISFTEEELAILMELLVPEQFTDEGYPHLFNPEYRIVLEKGVNFNLMQDTATLNRYVTIVKFDGIDTIFTAPYDLFKACNLVMTEEKDDYSYLHIFNDGPNREDAVDTFFKGSLIEWVARNYINSKELYMDTAYEKNFRIDHIESLTLDDVDPNLIATMISFSFLPMSMEGIENSDFFFENEGWVSGGALFGALYVDERAEGTRVYVLGLECLNPDINETSLIEVATEFYNNSQARNYY